MNSYKFLLDYKKFLFTGETLRSWAVTPQGPVTTYKSLAYNFKVLVLARAGKTKFENYNLDNKQQKRIIVPCNLLAKEEKFPPPEGMKFVV
ncbi:MAG: hypothetical protein PHY02_07115 [Phycisphaerae bacterium]|nr:hypothetical protein [Phycisphaerae bacterium]